MQLAMNLETTAQDAPEGFDTWSAAGIKALAKIAQRYKPDVCAVTHEPSTLTLRMYPRSVTETSYLKPLMTAVSPQKWADFAQKSAVAVKAASPKTRCAAGVLHFEQPYFKEFVACKGLDAISLDIYGLAGLNHIDAYDSMIKTAHDAGKAVYIEETGRPSYVDPAVAKIKGATACPTGDPQCEPTDCKWLETLSQYASSRGLEAITACGVANMQTLFYYSTKDVHAGPLDDTYVHRVYEAIDHGDRTRVFATLKALTAKLGPAADGKPTATQP
jgi:hypothetical protein